MWARRAAFERLGIGPQEDLSTLNGTLGEASVLILQDFW